ncbi:MAG: hypothetical protein PGN24_07345 [Microbacterium arborescens]
MIDVVDLERSPSFPGLVERMRSGRLPDAILCATDQLALAVLDVLTAGRGVGARAGGTRPASTASRPR